MPYVHVDGIIVVIDNHDDMSDKEIIGRRLVDIVCEIIQVKTWMMWASQSIIATRMMF